MLLLDYGYKTATKPKTAWLQLASYSPRHMRLGLCGRARPSAWQRMRAVACRDCGHMAEDLLEMTSEVEDGDEGI